MIRNWLAINSQRIAKVTIVVVAALATSSLGGQDPSVPTVPPDFGIDLQLGVAMRPSMLGGAHEIVGTEADFEGDAVFGRLVAAGFTRPFPWRLTLVDNKIINASSTAGGQIYVYGGMIQLLSSHDGLWAAVLSHEIAHTELRHQVMVYYRLLYNQAMYRYWRTQVNARVRGASVGLLAFEVAAPIALKKMERDQEHAADETGMLIMARAGYHPDYVFALHHIIEMNTGDQSKFGAFFSDHPRWATRDQRDQSEYTVALAEFNRDWPHPELSPGGRPPTIAFLGTPSSNANKQADVAEINVPLTCRNATSPVRIITIFSKDKKPVPAVNADFNDGRDHLALAQEVTCPEDKLATPIAIQLPSSAVPDKDRSLEAVLFVSADNALIAESRSFHVSVPKVKVQSH